MRVAPGINPAAGSATSTRLRGNEPKASNRIVSAESAAAVTGRVLEPDASGGCGGGYAPLHSCSAMTASTGRLQAPGWSADPVPSAHCTITLSLQRPYL